ncbi:putative uncharacterized protein DDB_G0286901 [Episyrphus balteatus]|uniref:putative uncharacterized protein DDB_G0286901 n=1 Tax=Episyrphus balteatus TaxID=286459 RepID=UPI00248685DD|nr:putative uncharacterized protein DDB_G0286901 [Episyrphus balteatus]
MANPAADQNIPLVRLEKIPTFSGRPDEDVIAFIEYIDFVYSYVSVENQPIATLIIRNKIQGAAINTLRRILMPTWPTIKDALIQDFGVRETYEQILQDLHTINTSDLQQLFDQTEGILLKLNKKSKLEQSIIYNPENNESIVMNKFLNNLNANQASVIIAQNIKNIREAYTLLMRHRNLNKEYKQGNSNNFKQNNNNYHNNSRGMNYNQRPNNYIARPPFQNNFRNSYQKHQNSGQFRNYNDFNKNNQRSFPSGQYRNNNYNNYNNRNPRPEPMEVNNAEIKHEEVNFTLAGKKNHFP